VKVVLKQFLLEYDPDLPLYALDEEPKLE